MGGHIISQAKPIAQELRPILESGDRLSRAEFERRYERSSHIKKAELAVLQQGIESQEHRQFVEKYSDRE